MLSDVEVPTDKMLFSSSEDDVEGPAENEGEEMGNEPSKVPRKNKQISMEFLQDQYSSGDQDESVDEEEELPVKKRRKSTSKTSTAKKDDLEVLQSGSIIKKSTKKKGASGGDLDSQVFQDEKVAQLIQKMNAAADHDYSAMEASEGSARPTQKYHLLPTVLKYLAREDLYETLLEQGICTSIRYW